VNYGKTFQAATGQMTPENSEVTVGTAYSVSAVNQTIHIMILPKKDTTKTFFKLEYSAESTNQAVALQNSVILPVVAVLVLLCAIGWALAIYVKKSQNGPQIDMSIVKNDMEMQSNDEIDINNMPREVIKAPKDGPILPVSSSSSLLNQYDFANSENDIITILMASPQKYMETVIPPENSVNLRHLGCCHEECTHVSCLMF
jgi:hypothetical protein